MVLGCTGVWSPSKFYFVPPSAPMFFKISIRSRHFLNQFLIILCQSKVASPLEFLCFTNCQHFDSICPPPSFYKVASMMSMMGFKWQVVLFFQVLRVFTPFERRVDRVPLVQMLVCALYYLAFEDQGLRCPFTLCIYSL